MADWQSAAGWQPAPQEIVAAREETNMSAFRDFRIAHPHDIPPAGTFPDWR
jgi:hypothetical protein